MRRLGINFGLCLILFFSLNACNKSKGKEVKLNTDEQKLSYAIGQQIGHQMKLQSLDIDVDVLAASIQDALDGKKSQMTPQEMQQTMMSMQAKMMAKRSAKGKEDEAAGQKFLAANKKKKNVKVTKSGLQYEILKAGKGKSPKGNDRVRVQYKGTLIDGTEFDSSYKRNKPAEFPVNGVIKGWTEALKMMKEGAKWKLYVPSELAYGRQGRPGIPPNSVLIFEIELLKVLG